MWDVGWTVDRWVDFNIKTNVCNWVAHLSPIFKRSVPYNIFQWFPCQWLDTEFSRRLYWTIVSQLYNCNNNIVILIIILYGIYSIKYYYFIIINQNNFLLMSQLRQPPTTNDECVYQKYCVHWFVRGVTVLRLIL